MSTGLTTFFLLLAAAVLAQLAVPSAAQLRPNFYKFSCPNAESIVKEEVRKALSSDPGLAAGLVRLQFHDCFVRGCDASILLDVPGSEKTSGRNSRMRGFEVVDDAKTRLEAACPGVVSCADILTFAARDSVALAGGDNFEVPSGRRDGTVSIAAEATADLPSSRTLVADLVQAFQSKGLTKIEMVTLSGAHTLGLGRCRIIVNRLYNFDNAGNPDPSLNPAYLAELRSICPENSNSETAPLDPTPNTFDTKYYEGLLDKRGFFTSDQTLMDDPSTAAMVRANVVGGGFNSRFSAAMVKMGKIGVLTGTEGQIRTNCRAVNP